MATIKAFVQVPRNNNDLTHIKFRLIDGRSVDLRYKSKLIIGAEDFDNKKGVCNKKISVRYNKSQIDREIIKMKDTLLEAYSNILNNKKELTSKNFVLEIENILNSPTIKKHINTITDIFI